MSETDPNSPAGASPQEPAPPAPDIFKWSRDDGEAMPRTVRSSIGGGVGGGRDDGRLSTRAALTALAILLVSAAAVWIVAGGSSDSPDKRASEGPSIPDGSAVLGPPADHLDRDALRKLAPRVRSDSADSTRKRRPRRKPRRKVEPAPPPAEVAPVQRAPVAPAPRAVPTGYPPEFL